MNSRIYINPEGKPFYIPEMPEELKPKYNKDLEQAKQNAIPFENVEEVFSSLWFNDHKIHNPVSLYEWKHVIAKRNAFHIVPKGYKVEFKFKCQYMQTDENCDDCFKDNLCQKSAILKPIEACNHHLKSRDDGHYECIYCGFERHHSDTSLEPLKPIEVMETKNIDFFQTIPACDWTEDFEHENGNYINKCFDCGFYFKGHKRRVQCKICAAPDWEKLAEKKAPDDLGGVYPGCWLEGEMVGYARCMVKKVAPLQAEIARLKSVIEQKPDKP